MLFQLPVCTNCSQSCSTSASSVSVSAWTLVCISVERYYAICHPLRSRRWQTLSHSYKLIAAIWIASLFIMAPIAWLSELIPTSQGHHKCRETWPSLKYERVYNLMLDAVLLVLPLLALIGTYSSITQTLRKGMRPQYPIPGTAEVTRHIGVNGCTSLHMNTSFKSSGSWSNRGGSTSPGLLRRSNTKKALTKKKRVIKMLCAVVLEFFICWTPLYIINTIALFEPAAVYNTLGYQTISFFQLLAYSSSCCNPITYCFMNSSFRKAFMKLFGCLRRERSKRPY